MNNSVNKGPFFSVIIPTYNRALELNRCLTFLTLQIFSDFEVLVCDDGSTDNTRNIVESFKEKLNITYLWEENWGGPARPRNNGIKKSKGQWIAFLDSDDWWCPNKLQACFTCINSKVDLIYHDLIIIHSTEKSWFNKRLVSTEPKHPMFSALLCSSISIPNSSIVVRKELLNRIGGISENPKLISIEDLDTLIRLSKVTENFFRIPECLGYYWINGYNISTASSIQVIRIKDLYAQYIEELPTDLQRKANGLLAYRIGRLAQSYADFQTAYDNLLLALSHPIDLLQKTKAVYFLISSILSRLFS